MPASLRARALVGAVLLAASVVSAGCGLESKPTEQAGKPGDPAPAERALRLYLDDDRCDLMSDAYAESIDPDPDTARKLCANGRQPVDMLVKRGQYTIQDPELIDGNGVMRVVLKDGGYRDYTLVPGGPEQFQVDTVKSTTTAEYGQPLRLQAREDAQAEPVDARITVVSLERIPVKDLGPDEYTDGNDHYYLLHVRVRSRSSKRQLIGSDGWQLALKNGTPIATPRAMYTADLGKPLSGVLDPGALNEGEIFFASPRQVKPGMVQFVYGNQLTGVTLTWTAPKS